MDAKTENAIRHEQIGSFGQMMAGFSHDMKNHLGIIRESNGLMSDIIEMGILGDDETSADRLKKAIDAIERRVVIVSGLLHYLGGFAHRSDTPCSSFQVNELLAEANMFIERLARLKQVDLALETSEGLPSIYNDPSLVNHVLYRVCTLCLEQLNPGSIVKILTGKHEKNVAISFRLTSSSQVSLEKLYDENLQAAVNKLGGTLEPDETLPDHIDVTLVLPSVSSDE